MTELLLYFISSILFSLFIFRFLLVTNNGDKKFLNIYDHPNERKIHTEPIPQIGGIVLYICLIIELYLFDHQHRFQKTRLIELDEGYSQKSFSNKIFPKLFTKNLPPK